LRHAEGPLREVLGRVLGEVAGPSLGAELIPLAEDELPELRASPARALSHAQPRFALEVLSELAQDSVWFVRLRAVVALGELHVPEAIPHLLLALTDANRLVRMRAAEGLVDLKADMVPIFAQVVATRDRYGLHAYFAALENAGLQTQLEAELGKTESFGRSENEGLLKVLRSGKLLEEPVVAQQ
jgi:HEAT repeat protein